MQSVHLFIIIISIFFLLKWSELMLDIYIIWIFKSVLDSYTGLLNSHGAHECVILTPYTQKYCCESTPSFSSWVTGATEVRWEVWHLTGTHSKTVFIILSGINMIMKYVNDN